MKFSAQKKSTSNAQRALIATICCYPQLAYKKKRISSKELTARKGRGAYNENCKKECQGWCENVNTQEHGEAEKKGYAGTSIFVHCLYKN